MLPMIYLSMLDTQEEIDQFEELYKKYKGKMYGIAYAVLGNNEDAEDAVQNAFINIAAGFTKISQKPCNEIEAYIVIICRNAAIDIYRKNKKESVRQELTENIADDIVFSDLVVTREMMLSAVKQLPDELKDVLFLYMYEQRTAKETAGILKISENDVRTRAHRAKAIIRKLLKGDE